jgi:hypothetical protein
MVMHPMRQGMVALSPNLVMHSFCFGLALLCHFAVVAVVRFVSVSLVLVPVGIVGICVSALQIQVVPG